MAKVVKRGFFNTDEKQFDEKSIPKLNNAAIDLYYLINRGYNIKGASTFIGNHYLLSERQRLAITRGVSAKENLEIRSKKLIKENLEGLTLNIDGFNTIITLEVAFSNSLLLKCMDTTIRDLAALRSTYKLIDKTDLAINGIGKVLEKNKIKKAIFYLDAPISNSGELKKRILYLLEKFNFDVEVLVINNVDVVLESSENVVTSDAIILDKCKSFINLTNLVIDEEIGEYPYIDFSFIH